MPDSEPPRLEALLAGARRLSEQSDYETAIGQLEIALDIDPASREVRGLLASIRETLEAEPTRRKVQGLLAEAEAHLERREMGMVRGIAEQIVDLDPDNQAALELLVLIDELADQPPDPDWVPPTLPEPEIGPREEHLPLIGKIDELLSRPTGPDPVEVAAGRISERLDERDLDAARELLDETAAEFPGAELDEVRNRLEETEGRIRGLLEEARTLVGKTDFAAAERKLDDVDRLVKDHEGARSLRSEVEAAREARRKEERRLARKLEKERRELEELKGRQEELKRMEQVSRLPPPPPEAVRRPGHKGLFAVFGAAALVAGVIAIVNLGNEPDTLPPRITPPSTGTIEVVLSSPGRAVLDNFDHPDGGQKNATTHRFSEVSEGTHEIKMWREDSEWEKKCTVTVEAGEKKKVEESKPC